MSEHADSSQPPAAPNKAPRRRRSHAGRIAGAVIGVAAATGVGAGLHNSSHHTTAGATCGGTERWNVKVGNDPDAASVDTTPKASTVSALNAMLPGPIDNGGRMAVEKSEYTIHGYLTFFKHEADSDYHVVITDEQGGYSTGHSIVVELPDPNCFGGKSGGSDTSEFGQAIAEARTEFEDKTSDLDGTSIPHNSVPVTVTGVAFFDFLHGQTGHSLVHPGSDGQSKVIELHPVTAIEFTNSQEDD